MPSATLMLVQLPTIEELIVTLVATAVRTIPEASLTIVGGVAVAAYLRTLMTPERLRVLFHGEGIQGVLRTALISMTLPVCSIGVLPVLRELHRLGLPTSKLITLAIVAPLLNPISLIYALTVLSSMQILLIAAVTGILAVTVADVSSRFATSSQVTAGQLPAGLTGGTRLRNLLIASGRIVTGPIMLDVIIVVIFTGLMASLIPAGGFRQICDPSYRGGPFVGALLTLPQYVSPARAVIQLSAIERVSQSIPTGLAIYVFGVSIAAGTIHLLTHWYGARRVAAVVVAMLLTVCTACYVSNGLLSEPIGQIEETEGLDLLTRPIHSTLGRIGYAIGDSFTFFGTLVLLGTVVLGVLVPTGIVIRLAKIGYRDDDPATVAATDSGRMSKAIPPSQLGAVAICGMAIIFGFASYIFFPGPAECMEEMQVIRMDAVVAIRTGDTRYAIDRINAWDATAARLPVSVAMRGSLPSSSQQEATRNLRLKLHSTRASLEQGDLASAIKNIEELGRLQTEAKATFVGGSS